MKLPSEKTKMPGPRSKKWDRSKRYCDVGDRISWEDCFGKTGKGEVTKVYKNQFGRVSYYVGESLVLTEDIQRGAALAKAKRIPEQKAGQGG